MKTNQEHSPAYVFLYNNGHFYQNCLKAAIMAGKPMSMSYLNINYKVESYLDVPKEHNQLQSPNSQV